MTILEDSRVCFFGKFDFYAMIGGDEPLLDTEICQIFMEQALTVITSKDNVQRPFLINARLISRTMPRDSDQVQHKSSLPPDGTGLYFSRAPIPFAGYKGTLANLPGEICGV